VIITCQVLWGFDQAIRGVLLAKRSNMLIDLGGLYFVSESVLCSFCFKIFTQLKQDFLNLNTK